jgi:hypothetical protein
MDCSCTVTHHHTILNDERADDDDSLELSDSGFIKLLLFFFKWQQEPLTRR